MKWSLRLNMMLAVLVAFFSTSAVHAEILPGKGISIFPVQSTIEEETFQTLLVNRALLALGYEIHPIKKVDYDTAFSMVANNDATFMAVNWSPQQADKYLAAGGDQALYRRGHYIVGAAQGYLIDKKTADKYGISNIAQLTEPGLSRLFDTDDDGIADLVGCDIGWSCGDVIEHQLKAFDLNGSVTHHQSGYSMLMDKTISRFYLGESVLYYSWTPYWIDAVLKPGRDVTWLKVPFSSLPGVRSAADTALPNGDNYGFEMNSQRIVANRAFADKNPVAAKLFETMKLSIQDISAQNLKMRRGERAEVDIERHVTEWIDSHQSIFNNWLSIALSEQQQ